jgi:hypothetical protein
MTRRVVPRPFDLSSLGRLRLFGLLVAALTGFGLLEAWQGRFRYPHMPPARFWPIAIARAMPSWLFLAILVPLVAIWIRHWRRRSPSLTGWIAVHLVGGPLFVLAHIAFVAYVARFTPLALPFWEEFRFLMYSYATMDLFVYFAIAGCIHVYLALGDVREAERHAAELREGLARAELAELRAQLDPHFLFNSLNAVVALSEQADPVGVDRAVAQLSGLLRRALGARTRETATLGEEMSFAEDYVALQRLRFGARLLARFAIEPETRDCPVPTFLVQPLVENAVLHGMTAAEGVNQVVVEAVRTSTGIRVRIENGGHGFAGSTDAAQGHGIGLPNTRRRLEHFYGGRQSFAYGDLPQGGAFVELLLPWDDA